MGERKVLNNYIPPDFDPSIIPKIKRQKDKLVEVRMMLPFSLRCNTCGEYMYQGKKFNSKSEFVQGEDYLGIKKLRFYIKCTNCAAEITFKTDPKNSDYECESGASRNFELWRDTKEALAAEEKAREEEEIDPMKNLEHRTLDNKMEMDILDALDEMKAVNQRHQRVSADKVLETIAKKHGEPSTNNEKSIDISAEEEQLIKQMFAKKNQPASTNVDNSSVVTGTNSQSTGPSIVKHLQQHLVTNKNSNGASASNNNSSSLGPAITVVSRKRKAESDINPVTSSDESASKKLSVENNSPKPIESQVPSSDNCSKTIDTVDKEEENALGFLMGYGDDDDDA